MAIHLGVDTYKKRINVSGCWPQSMIPRDVREESPSISCGLERDPAKIAADILRRFIPAYQDIYEKCVESARQQAEATAKQYAAAKEYAAIMGTETTNAHASFYHDACYGHVDVNWGGDTATLELRGNANILKAALAAAMEVCK